MADWITPEDVSDYLDTIAADDPRLVASTAAVKVAVERRRADLSVDGVFPDSATIPADVKLGAIMWAGLVTQQRSAPGGFDGYDAETFLADAGSKRAEILRLIGWRRPVVA